eukprot:m.188180 g.188180  ORF g.188180 m.188180 type:complete len:75 (-) comp10022_c3_seq15:270-494(-)
MDIHVPRWGCAACGVVVNGVRDQPPVTALLVTIAALLIVPAGSEFLNKRPTVVVENEHMRSTFSTSSPTSSFAS